MVHRIYPAEVQLNKIDSSDTEAVFLTFNSHFDDGTDYTNVYDKWDFDFDIVNFPFIVAMFHGVPFMVLFISQLTCLARASSHVSYFNIRNKF